MNLMENLRHARRAGVPLVAIATPDPRATMEVLIAAVGEQSPVVSWDCIGGLRPVNDAGRQAVAAVNADDADGNPVGFLEVAAQLPDGTVAVFLQADAWLNEPPVIQGVWNLRDQYKQSRRMLVMLGSQIQPPPALRGDVVTFDESLPDAKELERIAREMDRAACEGNPKRKAASEDSIMRMVEGTTGLSSFLAETAVAMALRKDGVDFDHLLESRYGMIEQTKGLTVDREKMTFDDIGGLGQIKEFGASLFNGPRPPSVVVRIEEIEKAMGGASGDTSGTSQDILQVMLSSMEDFGWAGIIAYGCPGAGKSLYSKALASTFGKLSLNLDLNGCKDSLVGNTEKNIREAMKVIRAIAGDRVFCVATANRLNTIPGELKRRFRYGVWMFDFPGQDERAKIWPIHQRNFDIPESDERPDDQDFAGSDIRNCCELANRMGKSLEFASQFLGPVGKVAGDVIRDSRKLAEGRFLSATHPGLFRLEESAGGRRAVNL